MAALSFGVASAGPRVAVRKAFDLPDKAAAFVCMKAAKVTRAAYVPGAPDTALRCGHLLSTDALVAVRHWSKT